MIWFQEFDIDKLKETMGGANILDHLGIEFTEVGEDYLKGRMPVDERTHQPYGILHGGATCVLAETLGSVASLMVVDPDKNFAVGSVITANHIRPMREGFVEGTCRPVHIGRTKHVWDIMITNERGKTIAKCELTCAVTSQKNQK